MAVTMERVHLVPSDDDDLYSGYNEFDPSLDADGFTRDDGFQQTTRTSYSRRPPTSSGFHAGMPSTSTGFRGQTSVVPPSRLNTAATSFSSRPMTAVRGAGYSSAAVQGPVGGTFDPLAQAKTSTPSFSSSKESTSPEERLKQLEGAVMDLVEKSSISASKQQYKLALDQAKDAVAKEKNLSRQREQTASEVPPNLDLMYCALFNLAVQYNNNQMYTEALGTYQVIVKNKAFSNAGRLKLNMGNIYFYQGNYTKAIKFFRMALDQVPNTHKDMRLKIMKNIALAFVRMGQLVDAVTSLEYIMAEKADFRTALHLVACQYHLAVAGAGGADKVRRSFLKLLDVPPDHVDEFEKFEPHQDDPAEMLYYEEIKNDSLQQIERERKHEAEWCISTAAKLIAPVISSSFSEGYEWCLEQIKSSAYAYIANDLEISKAVAYLRKREFNQAIETLKAFEKKDTKVASTAATNLSFLYYLQSDLTQADKYADQAVQADRYNAGALVNKGNCCFANNDMERAVEYYREALTTEASCVEALYNQGLAYQKLGSLEEALDCFFKLRTIVKTIPQVVYQIGRTYELQGNVDEALEWYQQLVTLVPTDPNLLSKIGELYDAQGDKQLAFQYQSDSYRYFPSNIEIIDWLGAYYIESQLYEKAIKYFEKAAILQPTQVKWPLLVASCHHKSGNYQQALNTYRSLHRKFPENVECLRFLVRLTSDLGLSESAEYATKLKKAEKAKEMKEQVAALFASRRLVVSFYDCDRHGPVIQGLHCLARAYLLSGISLFATYSADLFRGDTRAHAEALVRAVRETFRKTVMNEADNSTINANWNSTDVAFKAVDAVTDGMGDDGVEVRPSYPLLGDSLVDNWRHVAEAEPAALSTLEEVAVSSAIESLDLYAFVEHDFLLLPYAFSFPLYEEDAARAITYAGLGSQVAQALGALWVKEHRGTFYQWLNCVVPTFTKVHQAETQALQVLSTDVVFEAYRSTAEASDERLVGFESLTLPQLFFVAACYALCPGEPASARFIAGLTTNTSGAEPGCDAILRRTKHFAPAFGCTEKPTVNAVAECTGLSRG